MAENKPVVESIKIGTLDKQIEILEKLGVNTDLLLELQEQIIKENADLLTVILNNFAKLLEQDEQKTIEELARTLLANQSEASVKYVVEHELIGKVLKHITTSDKSGFEGKTFIEILEQKDLVSILRRDSILWAILMFNTLVPLIILKSETATRNVYGGKENKPYLHFLFKQSASYRAEILKHEHFRQTLYDISEVANIRYKAPDNTVLFVGTDGQSDYRVELETNLAGTSSVGFVGWVDTKYLGSNWAHMTDTDYNSKMTRLVGRIITERGRQQPVRYIDFA